MEKKQKKPNAIEKALDILEVFLPDNSEMGTAQVSDTLGLHRATASRTLRIMTQKGFLQQNPDNKKYSLGPKALLLGRSVANSLQNGLVSIAKPFIHTIRSELNETVTLEKWMGESTILVYVAEGQQRTRISVEIGNRVPINAAAGAKAILAYSDPEFVRDLLKEHHTFEQLTPHTITHRDALIRQLREIRLNGYSIDEQEIDLGMNAFGVPVFNHDNLPVAGLVLVGPVHRVNMEKSKDIVTPLQQAAQQISSRLMQPLTKKRPQQDATTLNRAY